MSSDTGGNPMRLHLKERCTPATLIILAIVVFMGLFAAAVLYEGASFMVQSRTAELALWGFVPMLAVALCGIEKLFAVQAAISEALRQPDEPSSPDSRQTAHRSKTQRQDQNPA
jgi:hypothetical protein